MYRFFSPAIFLTACLSGLPELPGFKYADRPDEDFDLDGFSELEGDCDDTDDNR